MYSARDMPSDDKKRKRVRVKLSASQRSSLSSHRLDEDMILERGDNDSKMQYICDRIDEIVGLEICQALGVMVTNT